MATIRYVPTSPGTDPVEREVPDEAYATDHGIQWSDETGAMHIVPWSAILEFVGIPGSGIPGSDDDWITSTPRVQ
jgi:hypothetical protein